MTAIPTDSAVRPDEPQVSVGACVRPGAVVVRAAGNFDMATVPMLEQALARAATSAADVQLDLSQVTFFDAASLGALVTTRHALARAGRTFTVVNPARTVTRLLKITELDGLLTPTLAQ